MFTVTPRPERIELRFPQAVKSNFVFVEKLGLIAVLEDVTLVRYQSERVVMNVYHGRSSYEIGVEFARRGFPQRFNLFELLKWVKSTGEIDELPVGGYQASSKDELQRLVAEMAALVKRYAEPLLMGDAEVYKALEEQQSRDAAAYTREVQLRALRKNADSAWQAKDYESLLGLYGDMQGNLTPSEFMRFQYAEKQLLLARDKR